MEPSCIRQTLIPGTSKLFSDYLYNFQPVAAFYGGYFGDPEAFSASAKAVQFPEERRAALVTALRAQNGDSAALHKLAQPGTFAVVTGQQVGLFSGPAYTVTKALTAVKLAAELSSRGMPAVPVFWLATEDHDLAEVDHAWVFDEQITPQKLTVADSTTNGGPVGSVPLTSVPISELRRALGQLPFATEVAERVGSAYKPGATLGVAFRNLLRNIFNDLDLLYLDPLATDIRAIAAPFLRDVTERVPELVQKLRARSRELTAAGYHAQVLVEEDASLLFLLQGNRRIALRANGTGFVARDRSYELSELQELNGRLSPNALLRPVMQDYLLPTISYVAGPSEIAYFAQSNVLYRELLGRMPVIYPRNTMTILDARSNKLLNRYAIPVSDLLDYAEKVKGRISAKLVPQDLQARFHTLRTQFATSLDAIQRDLAGFDPTLETASAKSTAKILYQLDKMALKTARETMRRDTKAAADAQYLINLIYPHRHLQERLYSIIPFLAKFGLDLPRQMLSEIQLSCPDHMVRTF